MAAVPPAVPPAPPADYTFITDVWIAFQPSPVLANAHEYLNSAYGVEIPDPNVLFADGAARTTVKDDADLLADIRTVIADHMITPHTVHDAEPGHARNIINQAGLYVGGYTGGGRVRRLTKASLTRAMHQIHPSGETELLIYISIDHIHFDMRNPISYRDWRQFGLNPFPAPPAPAAPPTAADIAAAVTRAVPAVSAADIATALTGAVATAIAAGGGGGGGPAPAVAPAAPVRTSLWTYNPAGLPGDVRARYDNKMNGGLILGNSIIPYVGGYYHHLELPDKIICADGTLYLIPTETNEKGLRRDPVLCRDDTLAGIRNWYVPFQQHLFDNGYYCHPLWCFRRDHGGEWGFTSGDDADDDLPLRMSLPLQRMKQPLYRLLSQKDMFPTGSRIPALVESCNGDGYAALKTILFKAHPVFHDQPSTFITQYPRQRTLSMNQYYQLFKDYLQLRAFVMNMDSSLDNAGEIDIFIKNSRYPEFLNRVTRDERRLAVNAPKYQGRQLLETLNRFLMAPDSPAIADSAPAKSTSTTNKGKPAAKPSFARRKTAAAPAAFISTEPHEMELDDDYEDLACRIHHIKVDMDDGSDDESVDSALAELQAITIPDAHDDRMLYHMYSAAVLAIQQKPDMAEKQICIVCGKEHRFVDCQVLKNTEFLKQHYIRYCQQIRREATARAEALNDPTSKVPTSANRSSSSNVKRTNTGKSNNATTKPASTKAASVSFVDLHGDTGSDDEGEWDFQRGRI